MTKHWISLATELLDHLPLNKLSDALDGTQKINKIGNLLTNLRRAGKIKNTA